MLKIDIFIPNYSMTDIGVCKKCGKPATKDIYVYDVLYGPNTPQTETLCEECLVSTLPNFSCKFCTKKIMYGTTDFLYAIGSYKRGKLNGSCEYFHEECNHKHLYPDINFQQIQSTI